MKGEAVGAAVSSYPESALNIIRYQYLINFPEGTGLYSVIFLSLLFTNYLKKNIQVYYRKRKGG